MSEKNCLVDTLSTNSLGALIGSEAPPMQTVHFLGRVFPEPVNVTLSSPPVITWQATEIGASLEFVTHIVDSHIDIECRLTGYLPEYFALIYMRAFDICRAQVDLVAFKSGLGLTVVLETFIDPNGAATKILLQNESLAALCTAFTLDDGFDQVCSHVLRSIPLFMALRDLIAAISLPHVSPVDCARAIERLKHLIASPDSGEKQAWQQLRQALQIHETYLKFITSHSANPRHGQPGHIPGAVTSEVTRRAWVIMNRYFEYLKRGSIPLSPTDFPLLSG